MNNVRKTIVLLSDARNAGWKNHNDDVTNRRKKSANTINFILSHTNRTTITKKSISTKQCLKIYVIVNLYARIKRARCRHTVHMRHEIHHAVASESVIEMKNMSFCFSLEYYRCVVWYGMLYVFLLCLPAMPNIFFL